MIEEDLSRVEESATKSTYRLGVGFERCEKSAPKFVSSSSYHKEEEALKPTKAHYPSNPKSSFNPKREASPMTRSPCWRGSSARCTDSARRGGDLLGAALSAATTVEVEWLVPLVRFQDCAPYWLEWLVIKLISTLISDWARKLRVGK
jgi:hypothetical protein